MPNSSENIKSVADSFRERASQLRAEEEAREEYKIALSEKQSRIDEEINEVIGVFVTVFDEDAPINEVDDLLRHSFYEALEFEALTQFASEASTHARGPANAVDIFAAICRSVIWARKHQ